MRRRSVFGMMALALVLAFGCTGQVDEPDELEDHTNAELAHPGGQGVVRSGVIDVDGTPVTIQFTEYEGEWVLDGDILLPPDFVTPDESESAGESGTTQQPLAARKQFALWPGGIVYYKLSSKLSSAVRDRIQGAMAHWENKTPIRFRKAEGRPDYVKFAPGRGCSAHIGKIGGEQLVRLSKFCSKGNVIHEIGHTVGLWHEQSRTDRNDFVRVRWDNIQDGQDHNFQTYVQQGFDGRNVGSYQIKSIMHYGSFAFSRNGKPTLVRRSDGSTFDSNRTGLTDRDVNGVSKIYEPVL
jgi:hypothetical protein